MSFNSIFEFVRVLFAFSIVFFAVPLLAEGNGIWRRDSARKTPEEWMMTALGAFVRASFAAEIACLVLGQLRLCLPGVIISACLVLAVRGVFARQPTHAGASDDGWRDLWRRLLMFLEKERSARTRFHFRNLYLCLPALSWKCKLILCSIALLLIVEIRIPLQQARFDQSESYLRTISLAALTGGQPWKPDGSVAFLAPLISFSGLHAASVIRFTGPILATVFFLLIVLCLWRVWRSWMAAIVALAFFVWLSFSSINTNWELLPGSIASIYGVAAGAIWQHSWKHGVLAALTGVMIAPDQWIVIIACGWIVASLSLSIWTRTPVSQRAAAVLASVFFLNIVLFWQTQKPPARVFQYESAARICEQIGREFPRNEWLIISPFQELAFTYGRGWHFELSNFVSEFTPNEVSKPTFSFPYNSAHVFFFVERRPLRLGSLPGTRLAEWRYAPAQSQDWSAFLYGDSLGRASLEYRAAELLNAYAQSHKDLSLFYADDDLMIYHLKKSVLAGV